MSHARRLVSWLGKLRTDPISALERLVHVARARVVFRGCEVSDGVAASGYVRALGPGVIRLDAGTTFVGGMVPTELISHPGAVVQIGEGGMVNYGVSLEAYEGITIGRRCLLASFVRVSDRAGGHGAPVVIGDDVWLAHGVIIEPGVTIGAGSVVAAGSVVTSDVPPGSLASGNPAQCSPLESRPAGAPSEVRSWRSN
jgi:acetyltransferase-like isoleucine patch superfamily enzyme